MLLNKEICWYCKEEFEYEGNQYQDVRCPNCKILNSFYDPKDFEPEGKEDGGTFLQET